MAEERALNTGERPSRKGKPADRGKLKIGDDWNAIRIIALSQSNPLKAIAEFVENSIDAHAIHAMCSSAHRCGSKADLWFDTILTKI